MLLLYISGIGEGLFLVLRDHDIEDDRQQRGGSDARAAEDVLKPLRHEALHRRRRADAEAEAEREAGCARSAHTAKCSSVSSSPSSIPSN